MYTNPDIKNTNFLNAKFQNRIGIMFRYSGKAIVGGSLLLAACGDRLAGIGRAPQFSPIAVTTPTAPTQLSPATPATSAAGGSIWRGAEGSGVRVSPGAATRPWAVGDVITVDVAVNEGGVAAGASDRTTQNGFGGQIAGFGGVATTSGSRASATASTSRSQQLYLRIPARIMQQLPDGGLVLSGRQETGIGQDIRAKVISGVARPADIRPDGSIPYTALAGGRLDYTGEGPIEDVGRPRWGQRLLDSILPF